MLDKNLNSDTFRSYYYLKEELVAFCKQEGLQASGGKTELTERIAHYLDTGERLTSQNARSYTHSRIASISDDDTVEEGFICSEKHRAFFVQRIGKGFTFNVAFQKWLKTNAGKTYKEAIEAYHRIIAEKKTTKTTIDSQFEYNAYIRDFFEKNQGRSLDDAIKCWKYKKGVQGHNRYEKTDLLALDQVAQVIGCLYMRNGEQI